MTSALHLDASAHTLLLDLSVGSFLLVSKRARDGSRLRSSQVSTQSQMLHTGSAGAPDLHQVLAWLGCEHNGPIHRRGL